MSDREWNKQWDMLMKPGVYEVTVADMLLPALSHALGLDILIFNTFKASRSFSGGDGPFLLSQSDCWGGEASKKPPLLIAYNGVHYEQLKPKTKRDEFLTKKLVENMKNSEIVLRYEQCPIFDELEKRKESDSSTQRNDKESWANVVRRGERGEKEMVSKKRKMQNVEARERQMRERVERERVEREKKDAENERRAAEKVKERELAAQKESEHFEKDNAENLRAAKDKLDKCKKETKHFAGLVKSLGIENGNERETLKKLKTVGEEMMRLLVKIDGVTNIDANLKNKRKNIVTALNSLMDLNDLNIASIEKKLTSSNPLEMGSEATGLSSECLGGLGATVQTSGCPEVLSGSVRDGTGIFIFDHSPWQFEFIQKIPFILVCTSHPLRFQWEWRKQGRLRGQ